MRLNKDKCHLFVVGYKPYGITLEKLEFGKVKMKNYLD